MILEGIILKQNNYIWHIKSPWSTLNSFFQSSLSVFALVYHLFIYDMYLSVYF